MKKILFIFLISFFMFPFVSLAKENDVVIESVELVDKSENTEQLTSANVNSNKVNVNLKLYDPGDYIEYNIKIKNVSNNEYTFDESKMITSDEYVTYEFSYTESNNVLKPNEERVLKLKVLYKNKVPASKLENDSYSSNSTVALSLVDNTIAPIINPATGTYNPLIYIALLVVSSVSLFVVIKCSKKYKVIMLIVITALVIPIYTLADEKVDVNIDAKITIDGKEAYFISGQNLNDKMRELANNEVVINGTDTVNKNIIGIYYSASEPTTNNKKPENIVSKDDSKYPIYMWFEDGIIYWWSEDRSPNLDADSSTLFVCLVELKDISGVKNWDLHNVENMANMFAGYYAEAPMSIINIDPIKNWDTSNVKNMSAMFQLCENIKSIKPLENWDTSSLENLYLTFAYMMSLESLEPLKNWDTSKVTNMEYSFSDTIELHNLSGLENWNVSSATSLRGLFQIDSKVGDQLSKLRDISALANWDTSNVTSMRAMFQKQKNLESLEPLGKWDTSKVETFQNFCSSCYSLKNNNGASLFETSNATNVRQMYYSITALEEIDLSNYKLDKMPSNNEIQMFNSNMYNPNLVRIKTPMVYPTDSSIKLNLPGTFCDSDNNKYTKLDNTSPTQTWLEKCE